MKQKILNYKSKNLRKIAILLFLFNFIFIVNAYAYLDPGTGSYIFQIIIASLIGTIYLIKTFWKNIKSRLLKFFIKR